MEQFPRTQRRKRAQELPERVRESRDTANTAYRTSRIINGKDHDRWGAVSKYHDAQMVNAVAQRLGALP